MADLREDVKGLSQRVGELSLRVEQLEHENAELKAKVAAADRNGDYVTPAQFNGGRGRPERRDQGVCRVLADRDPAAGGRADGEPGEADKRRARLDRQAGADGAGAAPRAAASREGPRSATPIRRTA